MSEFYVSNEIQHLAEIVPDSLYFGVTYTDRVQTIRNTADNFYFTIDDELIYLNYYYDFGPLNISCLYKYCVKLNSLLDGTTSIKRVIHYTCHNEEKRANAAYLMGAFAVIYLDMEPKQAIRILTNAGGSFRHFMDASQGLSQHTIRLIDCLSGIEKAHRLKFFDFSDFNVLEYDLYDKLQNGDLNWLVPRKFLAFIGPTDEKFRNGCSNGHTPEFYLKYFLQNDVQAVIRLNNKVYDSAAFTSAGISHYDLFFPDGSTPPKNILLQFLQIAENCPTALAVHCKAGLGRTGSLIGAYIIKHYHMSAREAIAWMRICRPGSVIGQQQGWLEKIEGWLWRQGGQFRLQHFGDGDKLPMHKYGLYSFEWPLERKRLIHLAHRRATSFSRQSARGRMEQTALSASDDDVVELPANKQHERKNTVPHNKNAHSLNANTLATLTTLHKNDESHLNPSKHMQTLVKLVSPHTVDRHQSQQQPLSEHQQRTQLFQHSRSTLQQHRQLKQQTPTVRGEKRSTNAATQVDPLPERSSQHNKVPSTPTRTGDAPAAQVITDCGEAHYAKLFGTAVNGGDRTRKRNRLVPYDFFVPARSDKVIKSAQHDEPRLLLKGQQNVQHKVASNATVRNRTSSNFQKLCAESSEGVNRNAPPIGVSISRIKRQQSTTESQNRGGETQGDKLNRIKTKRMSGGISRHEQSSEYLHRRRV